MNLNLLVKETPFLYKLWFSLNKRKINNGKIRFPIKGDLWYFDGYPRSGNTFMKNWIEFFFTGLKGASHLHCVSGIKIATTRKLKSVIIFRNPEQAVSSFYYTKTHRNSSKLNESTILLKELLAEWVFYHSYVLKQEQTEVLAIEFSSKKESIFNNTLRIASHLEMATVDASLMEFKLEQYYISMNNGEGNKERAYSSLPLKTRDLFKKDIIKSIKKIDRYEEAMKIYQALKVKV
jgi:hypothetical protein